MKTMRLLFRIGIVVGIAVLPPGCTLEIVDPPQPMVIALQSFHGRYVTALGGREGWKLRQETEMGDCGWFTLSYLANGKVTLKTCHGRYVTAPESGAEDIDWILTQETRLRRCGQFDLYELGSDRIALKTCADRFMTTGDGNWPGELAWSVAGKTVDLMDWEKMVMLDRQQAIEP
jgi:hypothetical protein